jgi:hypothetical protein
MRVAEGYPQIGSAAEVRGVPVKTKRVRVLKDGWYGPHRQPVKVGEEFDAPLDEALGWKHFGKVEFV